MHSVAPKSVETSLHRQKSMYITTFTVTIAITEGYEVKFIESLTGWFIYFNKMKANSNHQNTRKAITMVPTSWCTLLLMDPSR